MNLTIRFDEHIDNDLVKLFTDYNVSSHILLDALYADYKKIPLHFNMPKERTDKCSKKKYIIMKIQNDELVSYVNSIKPGYRSGYIKSILRKTLELFRGFIFFNRSPKKDPNINYIEVPKDVLENSGKKIRRSNQYTDLYCKTSTLSVKASVNKEDVIKTPYITGNDPDLETSFIDPATLSGKVNANRKSPDESSSPETEKSFDGAGTLEKKLCTVRLI